MPYNSLSELPSSVKKLPTKAQKIFLSAFNSAYGQFDPSKHKAENAEAYAFAVAWSAVKKAGYKKETVTEFNTFQIVKGNAYEDEFGNKFIEVPVTGVRDDRDGDAMGTKAGNQMIAAYKSKTVPMFSNHGLDENGQKSYRWEDIMARYEDGWWADNGLDVIAKSRLNPHNPKAKQLFNYLKAKMPVGFSIGGKMRSTENNVESDNDGD